MIIDKDYDLATSWFQDEEGNRIPQTKEDRDSMTVPTNAYVQVFKNANTVDTEQYRVNTEKEVEKCKHEHTRETYGWIDTMEGRECIKCKATQSKKKPEEWSDIWSSHEYKYFTSCSSWGDEKTILAMANSGDYTLKEAIILYSSACERCMNSLAHQYLKGEDGYAEYSYEWFRSNTLCDLCHKDPRSKKFELKWQKEQDKFNKIDESIRSKVDVLIDMIQQRCITEEEVFTLKEEIKDELIAHGAHFEIVLSKLNYIESNRNWYLKKDSEEFITIGNGKYDKPFEEIPESNNAQEV